MSRRAVLLLVILVLMVSMVACQKAKPTPTVETVLLPTSQPAAASPEPPTVPPSTAVPAPAGAAAAPTATAAAEQQARSALVAPVFGPAAPKLLAPEDEYAGSVVDLEWEWVQALGQGQWFELQIKPDTPEAEFFVHGWYQEMLVRITSAELLPGRYIWRVLVVQGRDDQRGDEQSEMSEERVFILTRPSVQGRISITPEVAPTNTPKPTNTPMRYVTRIVVATPTRTPVLPTPTNTPGGYQPPAPTVTGTPGGYPPATATTVPATATTVPPTATTVPTSAYPAATATTAPPPSATPVQPEPTAEPTAYPGGGPTATPAPKPV